jgi:hypothetical protein
MDGREDVALWRLQHVPITWSELSSIPDESVLFGFAKRDPERLKGENFGGIFHRSASFLSRKRRQDALLG